MSNYDTFVRLEKCPGKLVEKSATDSSSKSEKKLKETQKSLKISPIFLNPQIFSKELLRNSRSISSKGNFAEGFLFLPQSLSIVIHAKVYQIQLL